MPAVYVTSREHLANLFGKAVATVQKWAAGGMPEKTADGYDIGEVIRWREEWWERRLSEASKDPEMYDGGEGSPALEEYRRWRAERERINVEVLRGTMVKQEELVGPLGDLGDLIRGLGDRLQKRFGTEALDMLTDTLDDWDRKVAEDFASKIPEHVE